MRLVEIRLLEGPNVYRLEPALKVEVALDDAGGQTRPHRISASVPAAARPAEIRPLVAWLEILRAAHGEGRGRVRAHRGTDIGHWVISAPWRGLERARSIAEAAWELAEARVKPGVRPGRGRGLLAEHEARIAAARTTPPTLLRDRDRRIPIVSVSGTNGKSTVTRLMTHVLALAGRRVGTTTSDGVLVDERLIEAGDWTGPGGAAMILGRSDLDVAVLETARGGILLRGVGYESNDVSVLTNISADHLDLLGIHTLVALTEVKSVIARITRPTGRVVLNADDPLVAAVASRVRAPVVFFSMTDGSDGAGAPAALVRHLVAGGEAMLLRRNRLVEVEGGRATTIAEVAEIPITIGGLARHNVENALAAAAGARAAGASIAEVARGLRDFAPSAVRSPGRLNLFRLGRRVVIVDYAHNEAGLAAILRVAQGISAGSAGRAAPVTAIIGTAGDRTDDALRGIGRIAAREADRVAIKETGRYLRGRSRESVIERIREGLGEAGYPVEQVPVYETETIALRTELVTGGGGGARPDAPRVIVLMCNQERNEVYRLIEELGGRPIDVASELTELVPRLQERPRRA